MKATYHSNRGEKSALLLIDIDPFTYGRTPVYVPRTAVEQYEIGEEIELPDHYKIRDMTDENGEVRTTQTGEPLKQLVRA